MSAHCNKCGCDIVYPEGTWPLGECPRCVPAEALRMACHEVATWRAWFNEAREDVPEQDVTDTVAEFLDKASASPPEDRP